MKKLVKKLKKSGMILALSTLFFFFTRKEEVSAAEANTVKIEEQKEDEVVLVSIENDCINEDLIDALIEEEPFLLKISPKGYTYAEIYETIDFVKGLVQNLDIHYPILYDIEPLMAEEGLRANCLLAEEFCNKLEANGCYVGLYGTSDSFHRFEKKFRDVTRTESLDFFDKMVVKKEGEVPYEGIHYMEMDEFGNITFSLDLKEIIEKQGLNRKENFVTDLTYQVKKDDDLMDLAMDYGIKESDLASYNNLSTVAEKTITIPNQYPNKRKRETEEEIEARKKIKPRLKKGIDVSYYQEEIDWNKVKDDVDYAIIRLCDFAYQQEDGTCLLDERFKENMAACEALDIPVGVYYFSRATNKEEAIKEATFVGDQLKEYTLEYPVYMDIETEYQNTLMEEDQIELREMVEGALSVLEEAGYFSGVYCNKGSLSDENRQAFITDMSKRYTFFITSNATYNTVVDFDHFKDVDYDDIFYLPDTFISMYQYTSKGMIDGITTGEVDFNYALDTLSDTICEKGFNKPKVKVLK